MQARTHITKAVALLRHIEDKPGEADAVYTRALIHLANKDNKEAIKDFNYALLQFGEKNNDGNKDIRGLFKCYIGVADVFISKAKSEKQSDHLDKAKENLRKALRLIKIHNVGLTRMKDEGNVLARHFEILDQVGGDEIESYRFEQQLLLMIGEYFVLRFPPSGDSYQKVAQWCCKESLELFKYDRQFEIYGENKDNSVSDKYTYVQNPRYDARAKLTLSRIDLENAKSLIKQFKENRTQRLRNDAVNALESASNWCSKALSDYNSIKHKMGQGQCYSIRAEIVETRAELLDEKSAKKWLQQKELYQSLGQQLQQESDLGGDTSFL